MSLIRQININGSCRNRPLQEDLVSSFFLWFSCWVAKFYGLARMLKDMAKQCWLLPYWSAYWVHLMSQVWEWIGRSRSNQTSRKSIPRQPDQPAVQICHWPLPPGQPSSWGTLFPGENHKKFPQTLLSQPAREGGSHTWGQAWGISLAQQCCKDCWFPGITASPSHPPSNWAGIFVGVVYLIQLWETYSPWHHFPGLGMFDFSHVMVG